MPHALNVTAYQTLIKQRCGLLFEGDDRSKLERAVHQRSAALKIATPAYYPRLEQDAQEFQQLVNLLTINETYFFREPQQIDWLVQRLAPRLLASSQGQAPLRILSAGCSSGEEPYSIAIALLEKYGASTARLFTLLGGDIDSNMLLKAQAGRYSEFSFRGVPDALRSRYFTPSASGWQINDEVRQLVQFHALNLLTQQPGPGLQPCDVIFLRNVSIYFDSDTRKQIQCNLAHLLKENGILVIGMAETLANDLGVLPMAEEQGLYYFYKGTAPAKPAPPNRAPASPGNATPIPPAPLVTPKDWRQPAAGLSTWSLDALRQAVREKRYDQALPELERLLEQAAPASAEQLPALLLKAHILLERKNFAAAQALAQQGLRQDEWCVDAWLLLGLAAKWQGDQAEAIRCLKQAIYTRQDCWPAQYHLAELWRASGDSRQARRGYRVVLQLLSNTAAPTGLGYLPLDLPASQVRFLSQHQLDRLEAA